jgi:hypothetical protein
MKNQLNHNNHKAISIISHIKKNKTINSSLFQNKELNVNKLTSTHKKNIQNSIKGSGTRRLKLSKKKTWTLLVRVRII